MSPLLQESLFCIVSGQRIPVPWPGDILYWDAASLFLCLHDCLHRALSLPICKHSKFTPSAVDGGLCSPPVYLAKCPRCRHRHLLFYPLPQEWHCFPLPPPPPPAVFFELSIPWGMALPGLDFRPAQSSVPLAGCAFQHRHPMERGTL